MAKTTSQVSKKGFFAALVGTALVAVCCFTPILVVLISAVGFSAFTPYLDLVLLPAFVIMIVFTILSYRRWRSSAKNHLSTEKQKAGLILLLLVDEEPNSIGERL